MIFRRPRLQPLDRREPERLLGEILRRADDLRSKAAAAQARINALSKGHEARG